MGTINTLCEYGRQRRIQPTTSKSILVPQRTTPSGAATMTCECVVFFFQAEDGIRDLTVTGVQTCALPISEVSLLHLVQLGLHLRREPDLEHVGEAPLHDAPHDLALGRGMEAAVLRRRVPAVLQRRDDGPVRGGPPDPPAPPLLHEARPAEARPRLGEVL